MSDQHDPDNNDRREPEAQAALERSPPEKLAPPITGSFSLVVLDVENAGHPNLGQAIWRNGGLPMDDAVATLLARLPRILRRGLSYTDALFAQLELVSCGCVAVFLRDDILDNADRQYLIDLFADLRTSPEFEMVSVRIDTVRSDQPGQDFLRWFLGRDELELPLELRVMRKQARAMQSWAEKIGGVVVTVDEH